MSSKTVTAEDLLAEAGWAQRLARCLVQNDADADDLLQETWIAATRTRIERGTLRPWLRRVLKNRAYNRSRDERRRRAGHEAAVAETIATVPPPDELLARMQLQRLLAEEVCALAEPLRQTVLLRFYEGLTSADISRALGVPAGTVRWRLKQALDELRERLDARHRGDRQAWMAILAPLVQRTVAPRRTTGRPWATARMAMVAALPVALATLWWASSHRPDTAAHGRWTPTQPRHALLSGDRTSGDRVSDPEAPTALIEGVVRDEHGQPIAGASIVAARVLRLEVLRARRPSIMPPMVSGVTEANGRYRLHVPAGQYGLTAMSVGRQPADAGPLQLAVGASVASDFTLPPGGTSLTGRVLDSGGGGVPKAHLLAADSATYAATDAPRIYETHADESGVYALSLSPGAYLLLLDAGGYASAEASVYLAGDERRDLSLDPAAHVAGRVHRRDTHEAAGRAELSLSSMDRSNPAITALTIADDDGSFAFDDVAPGQYRVLARWGKQTGVGEPFPVLPGQTLAAVDIPLDPGYAVRGRAASPDGAPVANALLALRSGGGTLDTNLSTHTGPDGRYELLGVLPGRVMLVLEVPGFQTAVREVKVGQHDIDGADVDLVPEGTYEGRVLNRQGQPVERALVGVNGGYNVRTDSSGRFHLASRGRKEVISAVHPDWGVATLDSTPPAPGESREVTLTLAPGASLSGTVRAEDGTPAAGVKVVVSGYARTIRIGLTDAQGRYRVTQIPAGDNSIQARRTDGRLRNSARPCGDYRELSVKAGEQLTGIDLTVRNSGHNSISGIVLDPTGHPVPGAVVQALADTGGCEFNDTPSSPSATSNDEGRFSITDLSPGKMKLHASHPDFADIDLPGVNAGAADVALKLAAGAAVSGTTTDTDGRPVVDYTLQLLAAAPGTETPYTKTIRRGELRLVQRVHDPAGAFRLRGVQAGPYELKVVTPSDTTASVPLDVHDGDRREGLRIQVAEGVRLTGRVLEDETDVPIFRATVSAGGTNEQHGGETDRSGAFTVEGLPPGEHVRVSITDTDRKHGSARLELDVPSNVKTMDAGVFHLKRPPSDDGTLGMGCTFLKEGIRIDVVHPDTPASRAGITSGHFILAIDGKDVKQLSLGELMTLTSGKIGTTSTMTLALPGAAPRTVTLTRVPYR